MTILYFRKNLHNFNVKGYQRITFLFNCICFKRDVGLYGNAIFNAKMFPQIFLRSTGTVDPDPKGVFASTQGGTIVCAVRCIVRT